MTAQDLSSLLLRPGGKIGPSAMMRGGLFLIGFGTLLHAVQLLNIPEGLIALASIVGFGVIIPWVFLWTKRLRDGGLNPVLCLIPIMAFPILALILIIIGIGDVFGEAMSAGMALQDDQVAMQAAMEEVILANERKVQIASLIMPIFASLIILFIGNALIKSKSV